MKIDIEETKKVAELYGIEIVPIGEKNNSHKGRVKSSPDEIAKAFKVIANRLGNVEYTNDECDNKIVGIDLANGDDKTIYFKNGSSITPVNSEDVVRSNRCKDLYIRLEKFEDKVEFLEKCLGIKLHWYQKVWLRLTEKFR